MRTLAAQPLPPPSAPAIGPTLPEAAHTFVGSWRHLKSEGYSDFLQDVIGLPWGVRKIAERIHPSPIFRLEAGGSELHCETVCLGGKPIFEQVCEGHSSFHEPNQGIDYDVHARWEGDVFVADRTHPTVNGGLPTVKRVYLSAGGAELTIHQTWGGKKRFIAQFTRK